MEFTIKTERTTSIEKEIKFNINKEILQRKLYQKTL